MAAVFEPAAKAESLVYPDSRSSCFHARRALELAVHWLYKHDSTLKLPYQDHLSALIHEPTFRQRRRPGDLCQDQSYQRPWQSRRPQPQAGAAARCADGDERTFSLHVLAGAHLCARGEAGGRSFIQSGSASQEQRRSRRRRWNNCRSLESQLRERDEKLSELLSGKKALDDELERLRIEVAEAKKQNAARPDDHDYSEAETRDYFIDLLLKEAGWALANPQDREFPVTGMPNNAGEGFVDYVLWGDDGKPLGLVEAKRTKRDSRVGQQQAKLYADCLEKQFGQRPIIFYSNGYDHWMWDDASYPPRPVQGFYKKAELELLIQRRDDA